MNYELNIVTKVLKNKWFHIIILFRILKLFFLWYTHNNSLFVYLLVLINWISLLLFILVSISLIYLLIYITDLTIEPINQSRSKIQEFDSSSASRHLLFLGHPNASFKRALWLMIKEPVWWKIRYRKLPWLPLQLYNLLLLLSILR